MNTHDDKGAIPDGLEAVASPAAANEAVSKTEQEDDGIVIATPSESWVLLDSKSDDEEVTLDEASTTSRRQPGLIAAAVACALVVAAAGAFAATRPFAVVEPPPPPPPVKRFVLASALDSVAAAAAKVRADGIDAQFELATGLDGKLASAAAVRLEALAKLSVTRCVEIKFQGAPDSLMHSTQAARLDKLDEQYGAQEKLDRAVVVVSDYVENASLSDARKAASGITDVVLGGASSLAVSVFGDAAVERVKEEVVDASAALAGLFPESHRPEAKTLATSVALGLGGLAVGVPFVPGITDNLLVGGVGAALPFLSGEEDN